MRAAQAGDLATVKSIGDSSFDLSKPDFLGFTALDTAADGGYLDIMRYLVEEKKVSVDGGGWMTTPLMSAVAKLQFDTALYLIGKGADMDVMPSHGGGETAWDYARRRRGAEKFMDFFISKMDDKRRREEFFKAADPVKAVPRADREDWLQIHRQSYINVIAGFARLEGFDLDMKKDGSTALHLLAAWDRGIEFVKLLSNAGADIFARDAKGRTAEMIADEAGNKDISDYLAKERITRSVAAVQKGAHAAIQAPERAAFKKTCRPVL